MYIDNVFIYGGRTIPAPVTGTVLILPPYTKDSSEQLYPSDFLRSSDWKYLPDNHEIYRKPVERGTVVNYAAVLIFPYEIRFSGWK